MVHCRKKVVGLGVPTFEFHPFLGTIHSPSLTPLLTKALIWGKRFLQVVGTF